MAEEHFTENNMVTIEVLKLAAPCSVSILSVRIRIDRNKW